jgi:cbb3-type cytochrome c oxidase subunit III
MRQLSIVVATGAALAVLTLGLGAQDGGNAEARKLQSPIPTSAESVAAGKVVFQKNCRFCHGPEGKGNGPIAPDGTANLTDDKWDHGSSDGEIFTVIHDGAGPESKMKGFAGRLSDTDIWNVLNFVRTLESKKPAK